MNNSQNDLRVWIVWKNFPSELIRIFDSESAANAFVDGRDYPERFSVSDEPVY